MLVANLTLYPQTVQAYVNPVASSQTNHAYVEASTAIQAVDLTQGSQEIAKGNGVVMSWVRVNQSGNADSTGNIGYLVIDSRNVEDPDRQLTGVGLYSSVAVGFGNPSITAVPEGTEVPIPSGAKVPTTATAPAANSATLSTGSWNISSVLVDANNKAQNQVIAYRLEDTSPPYFTSPGSVPSRIRFAAGTEWLPYPGEADNGAVLTATCRDNPPAFMTNGTPGSSSIALVSEHFGNDSITGIKEAGLESPHTGSDFTRMVWSLKDGEGNTIFDSTNMPLDPNDATGSVASGAPYWEKTVNGITLYAEGNPMTGVAETIAFTMAKGAVINGGFVELQAYLTPRDEAVNEKYDGTINLTAANQYSQYYDLLAKEYVDSTDAVSKMKWTAPNFEIAYPAESTVKPGGSTNVLADPNQTTEGNTTAAIPNGTVFKLATYDAGSRTWTEWTAPAGWTVSNPDPVTGAISVQAVAP